MTYSALLPPAACPTHRSWEDKTGGRRKRGRAQCGGKREESKRGEKQHMQGNTMLRERGKLMRGREKQYLAQCIDWRALKENSLLSSSPVALINIPLICACIFFYAKISGSKRYSYAMISLVARLELWTTLKPSRHTAKGKISVGKKGSLLQFPRVIFRHKELFQTL